MKEKDLRDARREKIFIQVDVYDLQQESLKHSIRGYILDISTKGALIFADLSHLMSRAVLLDFEVPWINETFRLKAKVVRFDTSEKGIKSGVQFYKMSEADRTTLEKLVEFIEKGDFSSII